MRINSDKSDNHNIDVIVNFVNRGAKSNEPTNERSSSTTNKQQTTTNKQHTTKTNNQQSNKINTKQTDKQIKAANKQSTFFASSTSQALGAEVCDSLQALLRDAATEALPYDNENNDNNNDNDNKNNNNDNNDNNNDNNAIQQRP